MFVSQIHFCTVRRARPIPDMLERLRQWWGVRKLVIGATFVSVCLVVGSLAALFAAPTARPKVPMRRLGAHCLVVARKRGNTRGAKEAGHQHRIGSTGG